MYTTTYADRYSFDDLKFPISNLIGQADIDDCPSRAEILERGRPFDPLIRLAEFENRFPQGMKILRVGGVHPLEDSSIINPYTGKLDTSSWKNVGEHCLAVAHAGLAIAQTLKDLGILSDQHVELIGERCLIHDASKRFEKLRARAAQAGSIKGDAYSAAEYDALVELLKDQGISADLADWLKHAGTETGHLSYRSLVEALPHGRFKLADRSLVDLIVHLADDMTYTENVEVRRPITMFLIPAERMIAADSCNVYKWIMTKGLALNPEQVIEDVKDVSELPSGYQAIGTYAYLQALLSGAICHRLRNLIAPGLRPGVTSDEDLILNIIHGDLKTSSA